MHNRYTIALGAAAAIILSMVGFEFFRDDRAKTVGEYVEPPAFGAEVSASGGNGRQDETAADLAEHWSEREHDSEQRGAATRPSSGDGTDEAGEVWHDPFGKTFGQTTGREVLFVNPSNGAGVPSMMLVGAPGMWPPKLRQTDRRGVGHLPELDVETLRGRPMRTWEVLGRATDGSMAYWGVVDAGDFERGGMPKLKMDPASRVRVEVVDQQDQPVPGATIRLSRDTVGFVHVNKQGGPGGRATFRAVPEGRYRISARASGSSRGDHILRHDGESSPRVVIRLSPGDHVPIPDVDGPAQKVEVTLEGLDDTRWQGVRVDWRHREGPWKPATLERLAGGVRKWSRELAPGEYSLRVKESQGGRDALSFRVKDGPVERNWDVSLASGTEIYVTDAWGGPVDGAWVQVWSEGREIASEISRGKSPIRIDVAEGKRYRIFAVDGRQGEGMKTVTAGEAGSAENAEWIVELDDPLLTHEYPPGRLKRRSKIESVLGQPLVQDADAWLIDATDPGSPAMRAGIERGDRLLAVWQVGVGWRVALERSDQVIELTVKP